MDVDVITLFPDAILGPLGTSIVGRAQREGRFALRAVDLRPFGRGKHRVVDDTPYGGGPGMVMRVDVVADAIASVRRGGSRVLLTSAAGAPVRQADVARWAKEAHLIVVCGHYEGIDDRIRHVVDEEVCLGDFVMTGGEIAAVAIVDAVVRLLPDVLGNAESPLAESFVEGLLEAPQYTRPVSWEGHEVPEVLRSGHHGDIAAWRRAQALDRTRRRRPDLAAAFDGPGDAE